MGWDRNWSSALARIQGPAGAATVTVTLGGRRGACGVRLSGPLLLDFGSSSVIISGVGEFTIHWESRRAFRARSARVRRGGGSGDDGF